jgi:hypothetical protein
MNEILWGYCPNLESTDQALGTHCLVLLTSRMESPISSMSFIRSRSQIVEYGSEQYCKNAAACRNITERARKADAT